MRKKKILWIINLNKDMLIMLTTFPIVNQKLFHNFQRLIIFLSTLISINNYILQIFQKMIFESCTLFHIMSFAKIIGPVEKNMTKSLF